MTIDEFRARLGNELLHVPEGFDTALVGVTEDSRKVKHGYAFFAAAGEQSDGHDYAAKAGRAGAVALVGERADTDYLESLPYIQVCNTRKALGLVAHAIAGDPSATMRVIGVTGTNGKTTTTQLITQLLKHAGLKTASFGTLGYDTGDAVASAPLTTPFGETLAQLFAEAAGSGCTDAVMEVSSHAIAQERIAGLNYTGAVFTNLTQDHLDFHASIEDYRDTKARLFERLPEDGFAIVNADDPVGDAMAAAAQCTVYRFGDAGDVRATDVRTDSAGTQFSLESPWGSGAVATKLVGAFNVSNMLAAASAVCASGIAFDAVCAGLGDAQPVAGRFELIDAGQPFTVVVDYAHTDDGLRNVLASARPLCAGRLIVVFGCGGDRDKTKRPRMAKAVAEAADFAVITSDNPRTEDPERILLDTEVGMQRSGKRIREDYILIVDRREAIAHALSIAQERDVVVIAGKGHEDYQILGTERIHFDDREVARELLSTGART